MSSINISEKALSLIKEIEALKKHIRNFHVMVLSALCDDTSESPKRKIFQLILSKIVIDEKPDTAIDIFSERENGLRTKTHNPFAPRANYIVEHDFESMSDFEIAMFFQNTRTNYSLADQNNTNKEVHADFDISRNIMNRVGIMEQKLTSKYSYGQVFGVFVHENELGYMAEYIIKVLNSRMEVLLEDLKKEGVDYNPHFL